MLLFATKNKSTFHFTLRSIENFVVECNFVAIFSIVVLDVPDVALRPSVLQLLWKGRGHPNDLYWTIRMVEISYKVSRSGTKASEIWFGV